MSLDFEIAHAHHDHDQSSPISFDEEEESETKSDSSESESEQMQQILGITEKVAQSKQKIISDAIARLTGLPPDGKTIFFVWFKIEIYRDPIDQTKIISTSSAMPILNVHIIWFSLQGLCPKKLIYLCLFPV